MEKRTISREADLKNLIKKSLDENGEMDKIRAALRSKILNVIRDGDKSIKFSNFVEKRWTKYDFLHDLVLEYFRWMGFHYSAEIFAAEIGVQEADESGKESQRTRLEKKLEKCRAIDSTQINQELPLLLSLLKDLLLSEH